MPGARGAGAVLVAAGSFLTLAIGAAAVEPIPNGTPEWSFNGTLNAHAGCSGVWPLAPGDSEKPYILVGSETTRSDLFLVFTHPTRPTGTSSEMHRVTVMDRSIVDDFHGGGSERAIAPIREFGKIPIGSTSVMVCVRDTASSITEHYAIHSTDGRAEPETFSFRVGGILPAKIPIIIPDVVAYPILVDPVPQPMTGKTTPVDAGTLTFRTMTGYRTVMAAFSIGASPEVRAYLRLCEDGNADVSPDGICSGNGPGSPDHIVGACVDTTLASPDPLGITLRGAGRSNVLVTLSIVYGTFEAPLEAVSSCTPQPVVGPTHGGGTHLLEANPVGELWYTQCLTGGFTGSCGPYIA